MSTKGSRPGAGRNTRARRIAKVVIGAAALSMLAAGAYASVKPAPKEDHVRGLRSSTYEQRVIVSDGPLNRIFLDGNLSCQLNHVADTEYEFYGDSDPGACGTFLRVNGASYGPDVPAGDSVVPYDPVSMTPVTGVGTQASPRQVTTVVSAPESGLRIVQTDSYVVGADRYTSTITLQNQTGSAVPAKLYKAGDCYLRNDDSSYGYYDAATGGIYCATQNSPDTERALGFVPHDAPGATDRHYYQAGYSAVWSKINQGNFPDLCECDDHQDTGAGLNWDLTVPPNGTITRTVSTRVKAPPIAPASLLNPAGMSGTAPPLPNGQQPQMTTVTDSQGRQFFTVGNSTVGQYPGSCMPLTITVPINPGAGTLSNVELVLNDSRIPMQNVGGNNWRATIDCIEEGQLNVEFDLTEGSVTQHFSTPVGGITLTDPAGVIYDQERYNQQRAKGASPEVARTRSAIAGATVSLQRQVDGSFQTVLSGDPGISPNVNPQITRASGRYAWDVSDGFYRVQVAKSGYVGKISRVVEIPPIVLDLHVGMVKTNCAQTKAALVAALGKATKQKKAAAKAKRRAATKQKKQKLTRKIKALTKKQNGLRAQISYKPC